MVSVSFARAGYSLYSNGFLVTSRRRFHQWVKGMFRVQFVVEVDLVARDSASAHPKNMGWAVRDKAKARHRRAPRLGRGRSIEACMCARAPTNLEWPMNSTADDGKRVLRHRWGTCNYLLYVVCDIREKAVLACDFTLISAALPSNCYRCAQTSGCGGAISAMAATKRRYGDRMFAVSRRDVPNALGERRTETFVDRGARLRSDGSSFGPLSCDLGHARR